MLASNAEIKMILQLYKIVHFIAERLEDNIGAPYLKIRTVSESKPEKNFGPIPSGLDR